jgi:hypothetical protein
VSTAIALVSIVSTAAVAIIVTLLSSRAEARRSRWQANFARFDELRSVLDDAVIALGNAIYEMNGVFSMLEQELGEEEARQELLKKLENHLNEVGRYKERIALRLGRGASLSAAYGSAYETCWEAWNIFVEVIWQGAEFDPAKRQRVVGLTEKAAQEHSAFVEAASRIVGPDLSAVMG